jgi:large subunit ribosomal protein L25
MEEIVFEAEKRTVIGKQVRALRREGRLPAVIYSHKIGSIPISLDFRSAAHTLPTISSSHLVKVVVEGGGEHTALVRDRQRHPVTGQLLHIDFLAVSMTDKLRAMVSITLHGDAPAMKNFNAVMVTGQEEVEVECLPGDLPERIEVDLSSLNEIGDGIYVRDLHLSSAIEILTPADEMIVLMTAPTVAPAEEAEEVAAAAEPEVIERGKREEEEF